MDLATMAYRSLTKKQKEVWDLVMKDCLTQYTAAIVLKTTRNAVKDRLAKAKKRYTKFIKENK